MAYATLEELEARWRDLSSAEKERAQTLLEDAALYLDAVMCRHGQTGEGKAALLGLISCRLVQMRMANTDEGMSQVSRTAGSFTEQYTIANPYGNFQLTSEERDLLGISKHGRIAQVGP